MAKRLIIAFVLSLMLTVLCVVLLAPYGLAQVAVVPMMAFAVMAIASIVVEADRAREQAEEEKARGEGGETTCGCGGVCNCGDGCGCVDSCRCVKQSAMRPTGCCGPRPFGEASRLRNEAGGEGGGEGCGEGGGECGGTGGCGCGSGRT